MTQNRLIIEAAINSIKDRYDITPIVALDDSQNVRDIPTKAGRIVFVFYTPTTVSLSYIKSAALMLPLQANLGDNPVLERRLSDYSFIDKTVTEVNIVTQSPDDGSDVETTLIFHPIHKLMRSIIKGDVTSTVGILNPSKRIAMGIAGGRFVRMAVDYIKGNDTKALCDNVSAEVILLANSLIANSSMSYLKVAEVSYAFNLLKTLIKNDYSFNNFEVQNIVSEPNGFDEMIRIGEDQTHDFRRRLSTFLDSEHQLLARNKLQPMLHHLHQSQIAVVFESKRLPAEHFYDQFHDLIVELVTVK